MLREWNKSGPVNLVNIWEVLYRDARIVSLFGNVMSSNMVVSAQSLPCVAEDVIGSLMLLASENSDPIKIVINNTGGEINAGFAIIQAMEHVKAKGIEVWTVNLCTSASMATVILSMGTPGRRYVLDNTITHLHSGSKGMAGKSEDVDSVYEFSQKHFRARIDQILLENTGIVDYWNKVSTMYSEEQMAKKEMRSRVLKDFLSGERYLVASDAVEAKIVDKVLKPGDSLIDSIFRGANG